jgi:hypothetical protein
MANLPDVVAIVAKYPEVFEGVPPTPRYSHRPGNRSAAPPPSFPLEQAVRRYRKWRDEVLAMTASDGGYAMAVRFRDQAHNALGRLLRVSQQCYRDSDGTTYSWNRAEESVVVGTTPTRHKKGWVEFPVVATPDPREDARRELQLRADEARRQVIEERTSPSIRKANGC